MGCRKDGIMVTPMATTVEGTSTVEAGTTTAEAIGGETTTVVGEVNVGVLGGEDQEEGETGGIIDNLVGTTKTILFPHLFK